MVPAKFRPASDRAAASCDATERQFMTLSDDRLTAPSWAPACAELRSTAEVSGFIASVLAEMAQLGFCERDRFGVRLALEEAIINGIKHGNHEDPEKLVQIRYALNALEIIIEVEDQGIGFNPSQVPDPLAPENLERPGGRGVFLMRKFMTVVEYNERGNRVVLAKKRGS
jgi:serine/threonine-protein kinase RsbW